MCLSNQRILQKNAKFFKPVFSLSSESFAVNLRKAKRSELIQKARRKFQSHQYSQALFEIKDNTDPLSYPEIQNYNIIELMSEINIFLTSNLPLQIQSFEGLKIFNNLSNIIKTTSDVELIEKSTWAFSQLVLKHSDLAKAFKHMKIIEILIPLLKLSNIFILENILLALGSSCSDSEDAMMMVLNSDFLINLQISIEQNQPLSKKTARILAWAIGNLCKYSQLSIEQTDYILNLTKNHIITAGDEVMNDAVRILYTISYKSEHHATCIINQGLFKWLFSLLKCHFEQINLITFRTIGNILSWCPHNSLILINISDLNTIQMQISSSCALVRKEAYWILKNIINGNHFCLKMLIKHPVLRLVFIGMLDLYCNIRKEASDIIFEIVKNSCEIELVLILKKGLLEYLKKGLRDKDDEIRGKCYLAFSYLFEVVTNSDADEMKQVRDSMILDRIDYENYCRGNAYC